MSGFISVGVFNGLPPRYTLIELCAFSGVPSCVLCNPTPATSVRLSTVKYSKAEFASSPSPAPPAALVPPDCGLGVFWCLNVQSNPRLH